MPKLARAGMAWSAATLAARCGDVRDALRVFLDGGGGGGGENAGTQVNNLALVHLNAEDWVHGHLCP